MARVNGSMAFVFLSFVLAAAQAAVVYSNQTSFDGDKYKLNWAYNSTEDKVYFKVEVATVGWVGLGFSNLGSNMQDLDCVVGGVALGDGYLLDLKATSKSKPSKDPAQSYTLVSSSQTGSKTTIEFSRKRDTGDANDMQFTPGEGVYVAWAYHATIDAPGLAILRQHGSAEYGPDKLVFVPAQQSPTPTTMPSTAGVSTTAGVSATAGVSTSMTPTTKSQGSMTPTAKSQGSRVHVWSPAIFLLFVLPSLFQYN